MTQTWRKKKKKHTIAPNSMCQLCNHIVGIRWRIHHSEYRRWLKRSNEKENCKKISDYGNWENLWTRRRPFPSPFFCIIHCLLWPCTMHSAQVSDTKYRHCRIHCWWNKGIIHFEPASRHTVTRMAVIQTDESPVPLSCERSKQIQKYWFTGIWLAFEM